MKACSTCREEKAATEFHRNRSRPDGLHSQCKACVKASNAAWRARYPEKKRAQNRGNSVYVREHSWRRQGIELSHAEYALMYAQQGGRCAICGAPHDVLHVDHDHNSGEVRGLLCPHCNRGLGFFRDNPTTLIAAAIYLRPTGPTGPR